MDKKLHGKVAIVFGAGSVGEGWGNGKAAAVAYAREGARVVAVDLAEAAAAETREIIRGEGGEAISLAADVTKLAEVRRAVDEAQRTFGGIDILHNNVGVTSQGGPVETSEETWDQVMAVNVKGMFLTCKCTLPIMAAQRRGAIINISSIASIRWTGYNYSAYYASKGAVNQFTKGVAIEYASRGIRANCILPGLMDTPHIYQHMTSHHGDRDTMIAARHAASPTGRMGDAWDIAHAAVFLASDDAKYVNGIELIVDGGLHLRAA